MSKSKTPTPKKKRANPPIYPTAGQPTKYKPEYCQRLIDLGKEGKTPLALAVEIGVVRKTLENWRVDYPEFDHAHIIAMEAAHLYWSELVRNRSNGTQIQGSDKLITWRMATLFGEVEQTKVDMTQTIDAKVETSGKVELHFSDIKP